MKNSKAVFTRLAVIFGAAGGVTKNVCGRGQTSCVLNLLIDFMYLFYVFFTIVEFHKF